MDDNKYSRFDPALRCIHPDLKGLHRKLIASCRVCGGRGVLFVSGEEVQCDCKTEACAINGLDKAHVPREYWEYNWSDCKVDPLLLESIKTATALYKQSTMNWRKLNLYFHGKYRTGKTTVAAVILKEYFKNNDHSQCAYLHAREIVTIAKAKDPDIDIDWLKLCDIVVIDEVGKEAAGEWDKEKYLSTLDVIIRTRRGSRATILISNLSPEKIATLYGENFAMILSNDFGQMSF